MGTSIAEHAETDHSRKISKISGGVFLTAHVLLATILGLILGGIFASSTVAKLFSYQQELGSPFGVYFGEVLYPPFSIFRWAWRFNHYGGNVRPTLSSGMHLYVLVQVATYLVYFFLYGLRKLISGKTQLPPGSARFATKSEILKSGLTGTIRKGGIVIGKMLFGKKVLRVSESEDRHVFLIAPTRYGKGVGMIIPTLLEWPHSVVVLDVKGENWAKTSGYRHKAGHRVLRMDWTSSPAGKSWRATWNPFNEIRADSIVRDSQRIAMDILDPDGRGFNDHWVRSGYTFLSGLIMYMYLRNNDPVEGAFPFPLSMRGLSMIVSDPERPIDDLYGDMLSFNRREVQEIAREMLNRAPPEKSGVVSTLNGFLSTYRDTMVTENTAMSNFNLTDFIDPDKKPVSLYITVPPSDIERLRSLVRLFFNMFNDKLTKDDVETIETKKRRPVLFLLDELPSLGRLKVLEDGIAHNAQYGIRYFLVAQNVGQVKGHYGEHGAGNLFANCHTRIFFGTPDPASADMISKMLGKTVRYSTRYSYSGNRMSFFLSHAMSSIQESEKELLSIHQISQMKNEILVFRGQMPPIMARSIQYYKDPRYMARILPSLSVQDPLAVVSRKSTSSGGNIGNNGEIFPWTSAPAPIPAETSPAPDIEPESPPKVVVEAVSTGTVFTQKSGVNSESKKRTAKKNSEKNPAAKKTDSPVEEESAPPSVAADENNPESETVAPASASFFYDVFGGKTNNG